MTFGGSPSGIGRLYRVMPRGAARPTGPSRTSTISSDLIIAGDIKALGDLEISGQVVGNVECASLVVAQDGAIEGEVKAQDVVLEGRVVGSVTASRIALKEKAYVEGDLSFETLSVNQGAYFEGRSRRRTGDGC